VDVETQGRSVTSSRSGLTVEFSVPTGRYRWDITADTWQWDAAMYAILGRSAAVPPATGLLLRSTHVQDRTQLVDVIGHTLKTGLPFTCHFRVVRPDGAVREVLATGEVVDDPVAGRVLRGALADVTERNRAEVSVPLPRPAHPPRRLEAVHEPFEIAVRRMPLDDRGGGDLVRIEAYDDGRLTLALVDVAGHGAAYAKPARRVGDVLSAFLQLSGDPAYALWRTNQVMHEVLPDMLASALVVVIDPRSRKLTWTSAGHPPPLVMDRSGPWVAYQPLDMVLGAVRDAAYASFTSGLSDGTRVILYTDGLLERRDRSVEDGQALLVTALTGVDRSDVEALADRVVAASDAAGRDDDATVVVIGWPDA
jgi:hypothetical protein